MVDWYSTILQGLAGIADPSSDPRAAAAGLPAVDSLNMLPLILGTNRTSPRTSFVMSASGLTHMAPVTNGQALMDWPHKLMIGKQQTAIWSAPISPNMSGPGKPPGFAICGFVPEEYVLDCGDGCVWNVEVDPEERNNLNASSELLGRLRAKLERELSTTFKQPAGPMDPAACAKAREMGGFMAPWLNLSSGSQRKKVQSDDGITLPRSTSSP